MPRIEFLTLPEELLGLAELVRTELKRRGYTVKVEPRDVALPGTPTLIAQRQHETNYILVVENLQIVELERWISYSKSCPGDTRTIMCIRKAGLLKPLDITKMRSAGVGLVGVIDGRLQWLSDARDLAFHAELPDRSTLKPKVRSLLGPAFDRFEKGDWRESFREACVVLEESCRIYLIRNYKIGRVVYKDGKAIKRPNQTVIKRMPLGVMKQVFCNLISQNQIEATLCTALTKLNPDRVKRTHNPSSRKTEQDLRKRVGTHMWLIVNALSDLV